jgi:hypothetical protein
MPASRRKYWSGRPDLNRRPPAPKAGVLTNRTTQYADLFLPHVGCNAEEDASRRWAAGHDDGS